MRQLSLLGDDKEPEGFCYYSNFLTHNEEEELLGRLREVDWEKVKMYGVEARRKVKHFGYNYNFDSRLLTLTDSPPEFINELKLKAAEILEVSESDLVEVLLSVYNPGAGIGWHRDAPMFESLVGVSLGGQCVLRMREIRSKAIIERVLEPRSAYIIKGPARWLWQHQIPPVKSQRYSITFRTLRSSG